MHDTEMPPAKFFKEDPEEILGDPNKTLWEETGTATQQRLPHGALKASRKQLSRRHMKRDNRFSRPLQLLSQRHMEPFRVDSFLQPGDLEWEKDSDVTRRIIANKGAKWMNTKQARKQALKKREG